MTKFEELQAAHERLLEQSKAPADADAFVEEVQQAIQRMCVDAEQIPAPRERDQLRAILRFWASYVYDHTGTYPDTTLHPALQPDRSSSTPEARLPELPLTRVSLFWIVLAAGVVLILLFVVVSSIVNPPTAPPAIVTTPDDTANVAPTTERPLPALQIQWSVLTSGPSPFDTKAWAVKLQLGATGGNDSYIFWADGTRLPDASHNQFTVEGTGCAAETNIVGVTSGGQATSLELIVQSPLPECQQQP